MANGRRRVETELRIPKQVKTVRMPTLLTRKTTGKFAIKAARATIEVAYDCSPGTVSVSAIAISGLTRCNKRHMGRLVEC